MSDFVERWYRKWAEGVVLGFARGRIELSRALGMLRRASEVIGADVVFAIIRNVEENPVYLPYMTTEEKVSRLRPLKEGLAPAGISMGRYKLSRCSLAQEVWTSASSSREASTSSLRTTSYLQR